MPNKLTANAREAFQMAFDAVGGGRALSVWAAENPTEFYKLFARLIPTEVSIPQLAPIFALPPGAMPAVHKQDSQE